MYFVYSIQSQINPECFYVGMTTDVERRLEEHNTGKSVHTNKFKPWKLIAYVAFKDIKPKRKNLNLILKLVLEERFAKDIFRALHPYFTFSNFAILPSKSPFLASPSPIHANQPSLSASA